MAAIAKQCFLIFLLTLLFSLQIHARESQFFNKVPSNNGEKETQVTVPNNEETLNNKQQEQVQEPNFVPENENGGYGLYGHESGQFPPTTTTTTADLPYNAEQRESHPKYLPKNYNTESYVTEPEGYRGGFENNQNSEGYKEGEFDNNKNPNFYNSENSYYNEQQGLGGTKLAGKSYNYNNNGHTDTNTYYNGEQQGMSDTRFTTNNNYYNGEGQGLSGTRFYNNNNNNNNKNYYNHNVGNVNGVEKQGLSDTRFLENGKYFYDVNMEQNFNRGPYESKNSRGFFGNPENSNEFNNNNSYEQNNQEEQFQNFQVEEDLP